MVMQQVERGALALDDRVARYLDDWRGLDRGDVTIRDLLAHCGGLTAYLPFFRDHQGRREFQHAICALPLEYAPRTRSVYSDLGFMLLAFILEDVGIAPLPDRFATLLDQMGIVERLQFTPPPQWRRETKVLTWGAWRRIWPR